MNHLRRLMAPLATLVLFTVPAFAVPDPPTLTFQQASALYNRGDFAGAARILAPLLEAQPERDDIRFYLMHSLIQTRQYQAAALHVAYLRRKYPVRPDLLVIEDNLRRQLPAGLSPAPGATRATTSEPDRASAASSAPLSVSAGVPAVGPAPGQRSVPAHPPGGSPTTTPAGTPPQTGPMTAPSTAAVTRPAVAGAIASPATATTAGRPPLTTATPSLPGTPPRPVAAGPTPRPLLPATPPGQPPVPTSPVMVEIEVTFEGFSLENSWSPPGVKGLLIREVVRNAGLRNVNLANLNQMEAVTPKDPRNLVMIVRVRVNTHEPEIRFNRFAVSDGTSKYGSNIEILEDGRFKMELPDFVITMTPGPADAPGGRSFDIPFIVPRDRQMRHFHFESLVFDLERPETQILRTRSEAIERWLRRLQRDPRDVDAYCGLGAAYNLYRREHEAIQAFQDGLRVKPDDENCRFNLGYSYQNYHRWQEAADIFRELVKMKPQDAEALFQLGRCCVQLAKPDEAKGIQAALARLDPKMAEDLDDLIAGRPPRPEPPPPPSEPELPTEPLSAPQAAAPATPPDGPAPLSEPPPDADPPPDPEPPDDPDA